MPKNASCALPPLHLSFFKITPEQKTLLLLIICFITRQQIINETTLLPALLLKSLFIFYSGIMFQIQALSKAT